MKVRLGVILIILATAQTTVYLLGMESKKMCARLVHFDPRVGMDAIGVALLFAIHKAGGEWPLPVEWVTVAWLFGLGILLVRGKNVVRLYIASESLMALASIVACGIAWRMDIHSSHGFTRTALVFTIATVLLFSGVPLMFAFRALATEPNRSGPS